MKTDIQNKQSYKPYILLCMVCILNLYFLSAQETSCIDSLKSIIKQSSLFQQNGDYRAISTADNGTVIFQNIELQQGNIVVFKINKSGETEWAKTISETKSIYWNNIHELINGSIVFTSKFYNDVSGNIQNYHLSLSADGNFQWQIDYTNQDADSGYQIINSGPDDNIITAGKRLSSNGGGLTISREDVQNYGNVWSKNYAVSNNKVDLKISNIYVINSKVYIGGSYIDNALITPTTGIWLLGLDYETGRVIAYQSYQLNNPSTYPDNLLTPENVSFKYTNNNHFIFAFSYSNSSSNVIETAFIQIDESMKILNPILSLSPKDNNSNAVTKINGYGLSVYAFPNSNGSGFNAAYIDDSNVLQRQVAINYGASATGIPGFQLYDDNSTNVIVPQQQVAALNFKTVNIPSGFFSKNGCISVIDSNVVNARQLSYTKSAIAWNDLSTFDKEGIVFPTLRPSQDFVVSQVTDCLQKSICDSLKINGDIDFCAGDNLFSFTATKNKLCEKVAEWSADYNLMSLNRQNSDSTVLIQFIKSGTAYLYASIPGCTAKDSLLITIREPLKVNLGNDTSICPGNTLVLGTKNSFTDYLWQDNSTSSNFIVNLTGKYFLSATNNCNQKSSDTINVYFREKPVPFVGSKQIVCKNQNDTLNASSGYASYLWQDGTTEQYLPVKEPGKFWVTVSDINHCTGSDTLVVLSIEEPPKNFVFSDTSICAGELIVLKPFIENYITYLWNDGSEMSHLPVNKPGTYTLQVSDLNGCLGKATIKVTSGSCANSLIFPNAFTPDGNGYNDLFKPERKGILGKYDLRIYNRLGNIIFKQSDPDPGWDGRYKSRLAEPGIFVWICSYQFLGELPKIVKGTVLLIR